MHDNKKFVLLLSLMLTLLYIRRKMNHSEYFYMWVMVKVTLEQAMKAQRGSRGIALLFL